MKKTNGNYILIFLIAILWLGLVIWLHLHSKKESLVDQESVESNYSTEPYSDKELKKMAQEMNQVIIPEEGIIHGSFKETLAVKNTLQKDFSFIVDTKNTITLPTVDTADIVENTQDSSPVTPEYISEINNDINNPPYVSDFFDNYEPEITPVNMCGEFLCYTSQEFLDIYNSFEQSPIGLDFLAKYIYQVPEVDSYIKNKAEERGYQQRGFARESELVWFENVQTRKSVRDAYIAMRNEMLHENIRLHFVSGYRSSSSQRSIFKKKMGDIATHQIPSGIYDEKIDNVLTRSAIPGYSKHHSGYAADFGCGNDYLVYSFAETECYDWMSANNFENTKKHGFIPSYPENVGSQGPNPEPWEYVWVGIENIK